MSDQNKEPLSATERIKQSSDNLRGTLAIGIANEITGAIAEDDQALVRFHGMYLQDDRDRRDERAAKKLERLYAFMIRLRLTAGYITPQQWVALHHIAGEHSTGTIKITTRQTIQLHGVLKSHVKPTLQSFNQAALTTIATCGDINRNVCCTAHPGASPLHEEAFDLAHKIAERLLPKTRGYYEIWLDEEKIADKLLEDDPLYQDRYMPRKFKIGIAIPPTNDVDVLTNDLGLIAIIEKGKIRGYNICIGGGMSTTHGNPDHYARLASPLAYVEGEENTIKAVYEVLTIQRDYGNRSDRKKARLKYTVDRLGLTWWREELERRCGFALEDPKPFQFTSRKDDYGWSQNHKGLWYYTLFVENGRVLDTPELQMKQALLEIAQSGKAAFRFTSSQNLIVSDIKKEDKKEVERILQHYGLIAHTERATKLRGNAMACVAFNTCALALAEAQRYMPTLITKVEALLTQHGLQNEELIMRMTGCPNGCARPYAAEIGFVGTAYGRYNLHFGGDRLGLRLNKLYKESLDEAGLLAELDAAFALFKKERTKGETFGDFSYRKYITNAA
jgi:sulfite reductase (NADPH) hemoprotein beta-component